MSDENKEITKPIASPANPLMQDEVLKTGKSILRTAVVWMFAGMLTQFARDAIKKVGGK